MALHFKNTAGCTINSDAVTGVTDFAIAFEGTDIEFASDDDDHISFISHADDIERFTLTLSDAKMAFITNPSKTGAGDTGVPFAITIKSDDASGKDIDVSADVVVMKPTGSNAHGALGSYVINLSTLDTPTFTEAT